MKPALLFALLATVLPVSILAQSMDDEIGRAVLAAPPALAEGAAVVGFDEGGDLVVLREGTNGLMCWDSSDEPGQQGRFSSQCTSESNRARVEQNHRVSNESGSPEQISATFAALEESGERAVAEYGTMYYHWIGDSRESGHSHTNIAVPFATEATSGIPESTRQDAMWIMDAGTSGAHLMIPGF